MSLQALVVSADDKVVRVLRRVLSELEIGLELSSDAESAIHKLTRRRFEAVIVDCTDLPTGSRVLRSARSAPVNKRAVAVAIVAAQAALGGARDLGAHFVLHQPLSPERAKTSFRAVRALMKRERRRNARIAVEIPLTIQVNDGAGQLRATASDLGEGGMAVQLAHRPKNIGSLTLQFLLPGTQDNIECPAEVAWENPGRQVGLRFLNMAPAMLTLLNAWLESHAPEFEQDDPPAPCKLTDLSLGGCYLETVSAFPVRTRIILSMKIAGISFRAEGVVLVMHPELGMAIEFSKNTESQRNDLQKFIQALTNSGDTLPELLVEPEGLDIGEPVSTPKSANGVEDPLLDLFRKRGDLAPEAFQIELSKQRGHGPKAAAQRASSS
jgi:c-di-GMP-binding flagellar brake protein YcgR